MLTSIDIRQTLQDTISIDTAPQVILGACNPQLAHQALQADPRIAAPAAMQRGRPHRRQRTIIEALDPAHGPRHRRHRPEAIAQDATDRIRAALAS